MTVLDSAKLRCTGVYDALAIVTIDGFKPAPNDVQMEDGTTIDANVYGTGGIDLPGSANWFVERYGMSIEPFDPEENGILWTDYESEDEWRFSVLIDNREVEGLAEFAKGAKYAVGQIEPVETPIIYGDSSGTVTILKHPDGWVLL